MKTTTDGWPVYEDTGDAVEFDIEHTVIRHPSNRKPISMTVRTDIASQGLPGPAYGFRYFRHPHNAAAAWLKAVSGEDHNQ